MGVITQAHAQIVLKEMEHHGVMVNATGSVLVTGGGRVVRVCDR